MVTELEELLQLRELVKKHKKNLHKKMRLSKNSKYKSKI